MNQEQTQGNMTPEEAAASLGLSTRLSEQFLMSQAQMNQPAPLESTPEAPEEPQNAPQQEESEDVEEEDDDKLDMVLDEIANIKEEIKLALQEDGE